MKNKILTLILCLLTLLCLTGCSGSNSVSGSREDIQNTQKIGNKLVQNQPTPIDINYSLERYNLIRRAYWVNGMREKAISLPCEIVKPLGYIVLFTESGNVIGVFTVDGKVSSLNSYLTPDSEYYEYSAGEYSATNNWIPDVDGSYGSNDNDGIFFFTTDGKYIEWTGTYLYSDIPFSVDDTLLGGY
jgi:predicted small secreted protein